VAYPEITGGNSPEGYLADLSPLGGSEHHGRLISLLSTFLTDIRRHQWDASLPSSAVIFREDHPRPPRLLPRALAGHVMAQVEHPGNLDRWHDPAFRVLTLILIRCGLLTRTLSPYKLVITRGSGSSRGVTVRSFRSCEYW
jgi:hypothetical protein